MNNKINILGFRLYFALLLGVACPTLAAPPAPPTPGSVQDTLELKKPALPAAQPEVILPAQEKAVADPNEKKFQVNAIQFTGNSVFSQEQLQELVKQHIGKPLNLHDLNKIAEKITQFYRDSGYALARAVVPAQRVESGVVRIEIIEGKIGKVSVEGNQKYPSALIAAQTARLRDGKPATAAGMERSLLLINDLPGVSARAVIQPGAEYGTADMVVQVEEKPLAGSLSLNNHGRKEVGEIRLDGELVVNSPFGIGDQLNLRALYSHDGLLKYGRVGYSLPINDDGTRLGFSYADVSYDVRGNFTALGLDGEARTTELNLSHPYIRSRTENLVLGLGLRENEAWQHALGTEISHTHISLMNASLLYSRIHEDVSLTNAGLAFTSNFKNNPDGARQDSVKAKLESDVNHLRALAVDWDLYLRGDLALSAEALPDTEKFSLGGPGNVRGYPSAEVRGDQGLLATVEVRRRFAISGMPAAFAIFADAGRVDRKNPATGIPGNESLSSIGLGLSFFPYKQLGAKVEYAQPTGSHAVSDDRTSGRWWVGLSGSF